MKIGSPNGSVRSLSSTLNSQSTRRSWHRQSTMAASTTAPPPHKRTRLDRTLTILLPNKEAWDDTASRRAGISASVEQLHRLHGTSLILEVAALADLGLSPSTVATACTLLHRFFHHPTSSLTQFDVWSVAMASLLLATKVDDGETSNGMVASMKEIIEAFAHVYARRLILADLPNDDELKELRQHQQSPQNLACLDRLLDAWPQAEKRRNVCDYELTKKLFRSGPVYKDWHRQIVETESAILRHLGFTVYWIPDAHAHKFVLRFCRVLDVPNRTADNEADEENKESNNIFMQRAWNYCNDSCRLDLSVRYPSEVIACSTILLAARDLHMMLPVEPQPWWGVFAGTDKSTAQDISDVANAILGLSANQELLMVATRGFVKSLIHKRGERGEEEEGSFNDPGRFLWDYQSDVFDKELEKNGRDSHA